MGLCSSDAAPPNPIEVDLSHFELMKVVGQGGFGKVNAIRHRSSGVLYAMKRMAKHKVCQSKFNIDSVWIERRILSTMQSPFNLTLHHAFQTETELFLVMPFMQGGDLRFHLKERGKMSEDTCKFYAAELLLALEELHEHKVVYRDLKPENVLLDADGHLRLSDYGLAHFLRSEDGFQTSGQAGTRGYQAPEVIDDRNYGLEVDFWSYGVVLYELLHGHGVWKDYGGDEDGGEDGIGVEQDDANAAILISDALSAHAQSLLNGLLANEPADRLGCGVSAQGAVAGVDWKIIRKHPFFGDINWSAVESRSMRAPIVPDVTRANCSADADYEDQLASAPKPVTEEKQKLFQGWQWGTELGDGPGTMKREPKENEKEKAAGAGAAAAGEGGRGKEARATEIDEVKVDI